MSVRKNKREYIHAEQIKKKKKKTISTASKLCIELHVRYTGTSSGLAGILILLKSFIYVWLSSN